MQIRKKIGMIALKRKLFFFLITGPLLLFSISFSYISIKFIKNYQNHNKFNLTKKHAICSYKKRLARKQFLDVYGNSDPSYLDDKIENLFLLEKEKNAFEKISRITLSQPELELNPTSDIFKKNILLFSEESNKKTSLVKESEKKQRYPLKVNTSDIHNILSILENPTADKNSPPPQLIIKKFDLKKSFFLENEVYLLNMEIIKREFKKNR
jgi:hypothetical protein